MKDSCVWNVIRPGTVAEVPFELGIGPAYRHIQLCQGTKKDFVRNHKGNKIS